MAVMVQAPSRRDRLRAATTQEIIQTARKLLVQQGVEAVSLRAIAREMGMTAPALYRYFGSHEELLRHVVADIFTEIGAHVRAAIASAGEQADPQLNEAEVMAVKMIAGCREFRAWARQHVPEFSMLFGSPIPGLEYLQDMRTDPTANCGHEFGRVFLELFTNLYHRRPFPIPADADVQAGLAGQLVRYREVMNNDLPLGALQTFMRCWVLLYGTVSLEVFGHLQFALEDPSPMFELMLADIATMIGLQYPPPAE